MIKTIDINFEIYDIEKLNQAIKDFSEYYLIKIEKSSLILEGEDENSISEIFNEFMNYVIGLINE